MNVWIDPAHGCGIEVRSLGQLCTVLMHMLVRAEPRGVATQCAHTKLRLPQLSSSDARGVAWCAVLDDQVV